MPPQEQLACLKTCLKQSYSDVYRVVIDEARESGAMSDSPASVLSLLETRTMAFQRSLLDQQSLADREWDVIAKGQNRPPVAAGVREDAGEARQVGTREV